MAKIQHIPETAKHFPIFFAFIPKKGESRSPRRVYSLLYILQLLITDYSDGDFHVAALSVGDVARTVTGPDCCVERRMRSS